MFLRFRLRLVALGAVLKCAALAILMLMLPTPDKPIGEPAHKYHSDQNKSIHEVVAVRNRPFFHTHYEETYAVYSRRYHGRHYNIL